jgi:hypothetical protein
MPPALSGDRPRPSRYAVFAARLKDAHSALRDPRIPAEHLPELTKRVLAITALARHDVMVALSRLEGFFDELSGLAENGPALPAPRAAAGPDVPSSEKNTATQG